MLQGPTAHARFSWISFSVLQLKINHCISDNYTCTLLLCITYRSYTLSKNCFKYGKYGKGRRSLTLHFGLTIYSTALSKPFIIVTLRQFSIHLAGKTRFWQRTKFLAISPLWSATDFHVRLRLRSSGTSGISKDARRTWMNSALWLWYSTKPWKALELEMAGSLVSSRTFFRKQSPRGMNSARSIASVFKVVN